MAKAEKKEITQSERLKELFKSIKKDFGEEVCVPIHMLIDQEDVIINISPCMDTIIHGGIPTGSWVSFNGQQKSGKTVAALTAAANAQKHGMMVAYDDVECRIKKRDLEGIPGLDLADDKFLWIKSTKEKMMYTQDHLNLVIELLKNIPNLFVIIDSVSALCDANVAGGGVGKETMGKNNHYIAQFCDIACNLVRVNQSIICGITQVLSNTSGYGGLMDKAANRWLHQADIKLQAKKREFIKEGDKIVGQKSPWVCHWSAIGPPGGEIESYIRYGEGIDHYTENIELAESLGLLEKNGSWYTFEGDKYQGKENMRAVFVANPEKYAILAKKVRELTVPTGS